MIVKSLKWTILDCKIFILFHSQQSGFFRIALLLTDFLEVSRNFNLYDGFLEHKMLSLTLNDSMKHFLNEKKTSEKLNMSYNHFVTILHWSVEDRGPKTLHQLGINNHFYLSLMFLTHIDWWCGFNKKLLIIHDR